MKKKSRLLEKKTGKCYITSEKPDYTGVLNPENRGITMDLARLFKENPEPVLAFSGSVASAYLLREALRYGRRIRAILVACEKPQKAVLELPLSRVRNS